MPESKTEKPSPSDLFADGKPIPEGETIDGGAGSFAVFRLPDGRVARVIAKDDNVRRERMARELALLQQSDHHGIIPLLDLITSGDHTPVGYTMPEVICDLFWRSLYPKGLTVELLLRHAFQLINIVIYLQEDLGSVHGDIKPGNIGFIQNEDGSYQLVLLDWEMVCSIGSRPIGSSTYQIEEEPDAYDPNPEPPPVLAVGTPAFMSPEHTIGSSFGSGVDPILIVLTLLSVITQHSGYLAKPKDCVISTMTRASRARYPHWKLVKRLLPIPPLLKVLKRAVGVRYVANGRFKNAYSLKRALVRAHRQMTVEQFAHVIPNSPSEPTPTPAHPSYITTS